MQSRKRLSSFNLIGIKYSTDNTSEAKPDFSKATQKDVDEAVYKLNHCPRKCLGYLTPYEVF